MATLMAQPCSAQKLYSYEPLMMDPYSTIYVDDGSCSAGKVLRVQGAPRNQRRKKTCVPMSDLRGAQRPGLTLMTLDEELRVRSAAIVDAVSPAEWLSRAG